MNNQAVAKEISQVTSNLSLAYAIGALVICLISNICAGMVSTLMSAYLPNAIEDLLGTLDTEQVSYVGSYINSLYIAGWTLGGMLMGWFGDRRGRVNMLTFSILIMGMFTISASWTPNWYTLVIFRLLAGFGVGATMVLSTVYTAEVWGDRVDGRAIAISILAIGFPVGIISSGLVTYLISDWRVAFLTGFIPLLLVILCYVFLKETNQRTVDKIDDTTRNQSKFGSFKKLIEPENRINFFVAGTIFGTMLIGLWATFSWLPTWAQSLSSNSDTALKEGGTLVILLGFGGIIGSLIAGFIANKIGRKGALILSFAGAFLASLILYMANAEFNPAIYIQVAFLALFFGISQAILSAYIPELFPASIRSTATGICFNAGRIFTAIAVFFVGLLVPILGGYSNSLLVFSLTYLIGFIAVWFGEETKGKVL